MPLEVESKMGAVAWGQWPALRFPSHRVTGGGHPPPVPTERGVRISRTTLRVPKLGDLTCPVMRTAACLHADETRCQLGEERQHLLASELAGDDDIALGIDAVDLEHLLCKVDPDGGNCRHGRPSLVIRLQRSLYGTSMPCEAPSTSSTMVF